MTKSAFDGQVRGLIGHSLVRVLYFEIDYYNEAGEPLDTPVWNWDPGFDSLDYGLELQTTAGDAFWITWDHEICHYHLKVERNTKEDRSKYKRWEVSTESRWRSLLGKSVVEVESHWSACDPNPAQDSEPVLCPQNLQLTFESGASVYVAAFEIRDNGSAYPFADHVTVFFDDKTARQYGIGPYAGQA